MRNCQESTSGEMGGAPIPSTPLADALSSGHQGAGRIGQAFEVTGGPPAASFQTVGGFDYLFDLKPQSSAGRNLEIAASPVYSSQITLVASYRPGNQNERLNDPFIGDSGKLSTPLRDFRAQATFGGGTAQCYVELDISEGICLSLPGQSCTLITFSTFYTRYQTGGFTTQKELLCQAHLASGTTGRPGQVTDRVFAPFQAPLNLLDPPTMEGWLNALRDALCGRTYLATGGVPEV